MAQQPPPSRTKPLFLARLAGTQAEMGAQHGAMVADDAAGLVEFYRTMPERALVGAMGGLPGKVARVGARGVATAWQARLHRERPAELSARSRAFVEAAYRSRPPVDAARSNASQAARADESSSATSRFGIADRVRVQTALDAVADRVRVQTALYTLATMDSMQNCVAAVARRGLGPFAHPRAVGAPSDYARGVGALPEAFASAVANGVAAAIGGRVAASAMPACTSVIAWGAATADGELLFARNFDFPGVGVWDAAPAFVVNAPTHGQRYAFFARRGADTAVVTVVNEAGLVIAPHTRWHTDVTFSGAMIVDVVHDIARRAETLEDAIRIARERPISSTWGIAIGSAREKSAIVLEIAGPRLEVVRPAAGATFLVCANRYRTPALQTGQVAASAAWSMHSERRERKLRALVEARTAPLTAEMLVGFMGHREDVDAPGTRRRLGSMLAQPTNVHCAVVAPAAHRALVGVDQAPSCEGTWAEVTWSWEGPRGGWELAGTAGTRTHHGNGFTARERTDLAAPQDDAIRWVHEAARAYESSHDVVATRNALEHAVAAASDDPSLRIAAAWLALEAGDPASAVSHVRVGLARESDPYRRGQLLLWGTRAARSVEPALAATWSDELASLAGPHVDELRDAARKPWRGKPHVNLMMVDAY